MAKQKDTAEIMKARGHLTRTLAKLEVAESRMLRAFHKFEQLRTAKKRYERNLAKLLANPPG